MTMGLRRRTALVGIVVLVGSSLLMVPGFDQPGVEVDEGILVAFPAQLLHGRTPQGDFYYPYGPASVWTIAAADEVFGESVATERAVGMAYRLVLIGAAFLLALYWGLGAAALAAVIVVAMVGGSVAANAVVGFLALAMLGYALLARALLSPSDRDRWRVPLAGALLGASVLMRYDFVPAVVLAGLPALLALPGPGRRRLMIGAAVGVLPFVLHLVLASPAGFWRSARIAFGGRGHPARPPFASDLAELVAVYALATALLLAAGALLERRARRDPEARVLLGGGLFGLGMVPFALSQLDASHVIAASVPVVAMLPVAASVLIRGDLLRRPTPPSANRFALAAVLAIMFLAGGSLIRASVYREAKQLLTGQRNPTYAVSNDARTFRLADRQAARDVQAMINAIDRLAHPGQSVFVGPQDLRTAGANDVFLYYLLDRLKPASYFVEVDPHTINRPRNGFTRELVRFDFAILTTRHTDLPLTDVGAPTANEILASRFCVRAASGTYRLYQRCR